MRSFANMLPNVFNFKTKATKVAAKKMPKGDPPKASERSLRATHGPANQADNRTKRVARNHLPPPSMYAKSDDKTDTPDIYGVDLDRAQSELEDFDLEDEETETNHTQTLETILTRGSFVGWKTIVSKYPEGETLSDKIKNLLKKVDESEFSDTEKRLLKNRIRSCGQGESSGVAGASEPVDNNESSGGITVGDVIAKLNSPDPEARVKWMNSQTDSLTLKVIAENFKLSHLPRGAKLSNEALLFEILKNRSPIEVKSIVERYSNEPLSTGKVRELRKKIDESDLTYDKKKQLKSTLAACIQQLSP